MSNINKIQSDSEGNSIQLSTRGLQQYNFKKWTDLLSKLSVLILFFTLLIHSSVKGQINFGSYGQYTIQLSDISVGDLAFEGSIIQNGGEYEVTLANSYIIAIEGVKYLDVGVLITADGELLLEGLLENSGNASKSIPFTLEAAFANKGQENISDVEYITITSNMGDARFPILNRQFLPPGPPPPPPTDAFNQALVEDTAYLYLYGKINVGNVDAGFYIGNITITVQYDNPPE